jgi:hypothetical protein
MIGALVYFVIYLLVIGVIAWLLMFLVDYVPVPPPFNRVAKIVIMVVAVLIVILLLLGLVGEGPSPFRLPRG